MLSHGGGGRSVVVVVVVAAGSLLYLLIDGFSPNKLVDGVGIWMVVGRVSAPCGVTGSNGSMIVCFELCLMQRGDV